MANDSIRGRQVVLRLTNKSGGGLVEGDVVIIDSTTAASVTTTTTAGLNTDVIGVALETIAGDAIGRIAISGYVPKVNLSGAASLGDSLTTHSVAKQAAPNAARGSGAFGEVLGTGSTPAALLWGLPDPSGAGGMAGDALWDAAGDLAIGTGANTGGRLAIGTAGQTLRVNAGATAPEWVSGGRVLLATASPNGTNTLSFASIAATFNHLEITYIARSDAANTATGMNVFLNNDTTAGNYRSKKNLFFGTTSSGAAGANDSLVAEISGANSGANTCGQGTVIIREYAATTFTKQITNIVSFRSDVGGAGEQAIGIYAVNWEATTAVNRVDFTLVTGNFTTSTFRLYGIY